MRFVRPGSARIRYTCAMPFNAASLAPFALVAAACSGAQGNTDEATFQKVLAGALPASDGFALIVRSGGFPIATARGYLFAVADGGLGPYQLTSPNGAFANAALRSEHGVAWALIPVAAPAGAQYRFLTRYNDPVADPLGRRFAYVSNEEISLVQASGAHLERFSGIGSATVAPRTIRVWVPANPPTHVLYAHDGQNLFNPRANYGGWQLQSAAGPSTLIAGIDNSNARLDEYTHVKDVIQGQTVGGAGDAYVDWVETTVRPLIEARYGKPRRSGVIGSSLGGVIAYDQLLRHPLTWDLVASLSGTMGWGSIGDGVHNKTMIELYAALPACPAATLYLDSGGGPGSGCVDSDGDGIRDDSPDAADNYCENVQLAESLRKIGCDKRLTYVFAPDQRHNEGSWRDRSPAILKLFESL